MPRDVYAHVYMHSMRTYMCVHTCTNLCIYSFYFLLDYLLQGSPMPRDVYALYAYMYVCTYTYILVHSFFLFLFSLPIIELTDATRERDVYLVHTYIHVHIYIHMHIYICIYTFICIYTYTPITGLTNATTHVYQYIYWEREIFRERQMS